MGLNFTAIDFETANSYRSSACSVAMVKVRDSAVIDTFTRLIQPAQGVDSFTNTWVHGIGPDEVLGAPMWRDVLPEVVEFAGTDVLVAHNASFDSSVFMRSTEAFGYSVSGLEFVCTLRLARTMLALGSYSLPFVVDELGLPPFTHHDAAADARAAALVAVALAERAGVHDLLSLASLVAVNARSRGASGAAIASAADWQAVAADGSLSAESVCFTGNLRTMPRATAHRLVESLGGMAQDSVTKATTILVSGDLDPRVFAPGATMTGKLTKAFASAAKGRPIRVMTEAEFLELVDITPDEVASVKSNAVSALAQSR
ncbi:exonuclease domain-containing protein [Cellulomonas endometrii]|uniref:exonuclease domain-containing protein n=1 Tax=Cellulomonas endometrii TaxID=3036301 RepID=UPI0024ADB8DE|nr:exonuclease domain-containing protein [Cellulomonas endometrii]